MIPKTRVLMAIGRLYKGGAETQCRLLCEALDRKRFEVGVVTFSEDGKQNYPKDVSFYCAGTRGECCLPVRMGKIFRGASDFKPDIIHAWLPEIMALTVALYGSIRGIPVITSRRTTYMSIFKGGSLRDYLNIPAELLSKTVVSNADVDVANSLLYGSVFKFKRGKVVRNAFRLFPEKNAGKILEISKDRNFKIVYVGRFIPSKRLDILFETYARLKSGGTRVSLYLCGGTACDFPESERILAKYGADSSDVHFMGFVQDWTSFGEAFDLFAFPSVLEGMSNAVVEAFSCGLPVVACDIPANSSICENGRDAVLVPPNDAGAFFKAVKLLVSDSNRREELAKSARIVTENFTVEKMVSEYVSIYSNYLPDTLGSAGES